MLTCLPVEGWSSTWCRRKKSKLNENMVMRWCIVFFGGRLALAYIDPHAFRSTWLAWFNYGASWLACIYASWLACSGHLNLRASIHLDLHAVDCKRSPENASIRLDLILHAWWLIRSLIWVGLDQIYIADEVECRLSSKNACIHLDLIFYCWT